MSGCFAWTKAGSNDYFKLIDEITEKQVTELASDKV